MPAVAQTDIHRCIDANGRPLFTDQTCAAMQATVVKPPPKPEVAPLVAPDAGAAPVAPPAPAEPPPILCAATFKKLRQSVISAFAHRNANRMAGLMLWNGYGSETAVANIRSLTALMQQPLLDAGPSSTDEAADDAADAPENDQDDEPAAGDSELVLHLAGNDGSGNPRELRYGIVRRYGCLWLRVGS